MKREIATKIKIGIINLLTLSLLLCVTATQAALFSRGGGTMYYDDVLNVTWLADANYANTSSYVTVIEGRDVTTTNGQMSWDEAVMWADRLSFGGYSDWRLPDVSSVDGSNTFNTSFSNDGSSDLAYNITSVNSELAYMYYVNLRNDGTVDTSGNKTGCADIDPFCLTNTGPFSNLQSFAYWFGVEFTPVPFSAWSFITEDGLQAGYDQHNQFYAWAVRSGDVSTSNVPIPTALWLFSSVFIGLVRLKRKQ